MDDLHEQLRKAKESTAHNAYEFVKVELQTCFTCVEMGRFELSVGNHEITAKEIALTERGISKIERFTAGLSSEQKAGIGESLARLKLALADLKNEAASRPL